MAIPFKRVGRKDPRKIDGVLKYHPQLVTMGQSVDLDSIAYIMKDKSSLSLGDIQSVLTNYVEAMRAALFDGKSVNIRDFGVFSLSAHTLGATTKEECTVKNIKSIQHKSQHQHNKKLNHASGDNHNVHQLIPLIPLTTFFPYSPISALIVRLTILPFSGSMENISFAILFNVAGLYFSRSDR